MIISVIYLIFCTHLIESTIIHIFIQPQINQPNNINIIHQSQNTYIMTPENIPHQIDRFKSLPSINLPQIFIDISEQWNQLKDINLGQQFTDFYLYYHYHLGNSLHLELLHSQYCIYITKQHQKIDTNCGIISLPFQTMNIKELQKNLRSYIQQYFLEDQVYLQEKSKKIQAKSNYSIIIFAIQIAIVSICGITLNYINNKLGNQKII